MALFSLSYKRGCGGRYQVPRENSIARIPQTPRYCATTGPTLESCITHAVVWNEFLVEDDESTKDLISQAEQRIEQSVRRTLCDSAGVSRDRIVWVKDWRSLKGVNALERFHVMLYGASTSSSSAFPVVYTNFDSDS